jgi:signal transduction histidine kinase/ligand-binding sensor domain-containing protein
MHTSRSSKFILIQILCILSPFILCPDFAWALDPAKKISQFGHTAWRHQDGYFSGTPFAVTQTTDGYLWFGTENGLWRFDGVRFVRWSSPAGKSPLTADVLTLLGSRDGSLWVGTPTGLIRWKDQEWTTYSEAPGVVRAILERSNGEIWFARDEISEPPGDICRVIGKQTQCYGKHDAISFVSPQSLGEDPSGDLWIGTAQGVVCWKPGSSIPYFPIGLKNNRASGVTSIIHAPGGVSWVGMAASGHGLGLQQLIHGSWKPFITPQLDGETLQVSALLLDRQKNLWVGTSDRGLFRIHGRQVDHFGKSDGLSSDSVMLAGLFEDREGNIWVVTPLGLEYFHEMRVTTFSSREGLMSDEVDAVLASRNGTVWEGGPRALVSLLHGSAFSVRPRRNLRWNQVTALLEDHSGRLWVGVDSSLLVLQSGNFRQVRKRDRKPVGFVVGMTEDIDGNVWAETIGPPRTLLRVRDFQVQEEFPAPTMPAARKLAADPDAGIWLGLISGDLARYAHGKLDTFLFKQSISPDLSSFVKDLLVNSDGSIMGATAFGVIAWKGGKQQQLTVRNGLPCDYIHTLIADNRGALWLYGQCGLLKIANSELQRWWKQPDTVVNVKVFDAFDGAEPGIAPFNGAAKSPDGRLWFANGSSLQMIDPDHVAQNSLPPPVHIEEIVADHQRYSIANVSLPPFTRDIEIAYTALSFTAPQKVRFRYKLEGHDPGWQDADTRRQAFYTDLPPGDYRFRVVACNNDGFWNETGAAVDFRLLPAWYQTGWFRTSAAIAAILFIWIIYRLRVQQVTRAVSVRSDERLAERTRMARELHDTFIQTIQGSKMVVDDALEKPSDPENMHRALSRLSVWLELATREARAALNSLRESTSERNDLRETFQRIVDGNTIPRSMAACLSVVGDVRKMHPIVRDEVYRIGYEAIQNASQHSRATRLDIELRYGCDLTLRVSDNGVGIDPFVLDKGREGHFGLQGMRERSGRIGGTLTLVSTATSGTVITLVVPEGLIDRSSRSPLTRALQTLREVFGSRSNP